MKQILSFFASERIDHKCNIPLIGITCQGIPQGKSESIEPDPFDYEAVGVAKPVVAHIDLGKDF